MTVYGADPDSLRALARQLSAASQQLGQLGQGTSTALRSSSWKGADAEAARQDWDGTQLAKVRAAAQQLDTASKALERNADEQTRTSSVQGGGAVLPPGAPSTPGAPGIPGTGGVSVPVGATIPGIDGGHHTYSSEGHPVPGVDAKASAGDEYGPYGAGAQADTSVSTDVKGQYGELDVAADADASVHEGLTGDYHGIHDFSLTTGDEAQAGAGLTDTYTSPDGHVSAEIDTQASAQAGGHITVVSTPDGGWAATGSGGLNASLAVGGSVTEHLGAFTLGAGAHGGIGAGEGYSGGASLSPTDVGFDIGSGLGLGPDVDGSVSFHVNPTALAGELGGFAHSTLSAFTPVAHGLGGAAGDVGTGLSGVGYGISDIGSALGDL